MAIRTIAQALKGRDSACPEAVGPKREPRPVGALRFLHKQCHHSLTTLLTFAPAVNRTALRVARTGEQAVEPPVEHPPEGYIMTPTEAQAEEFANESENARFIAYDIETPYSTAEDSAEEAEGAQTIKSIQFSLSPKTGIFFPWREPFLDIARRCLGTTRPKLSWNGWRFDDPIIRANGISINGESHDLMWSWHHLQPDLPRGLQFVAAQCGWPFAWKHLAVANPQFYGIVDVDVLQFLVN